MARRGAVPLAALLLMVLAAVMMGAGIDNEGAAGGPIGEGYIAGAVADIPPGYLALYLRAAKAAGIDWAVLAAIGKIESDHGRSAAPGVSSGFNAHGCCAGPMQFFANPAMTDGQPTTWDGYGVDGNGDGRIDVYDPADAIQAAAAYLRASGAPADERRAVFAYNRSGAYVERVLALAGDYRAQASASTARRTVLGDRTGRLVLVPAERATRPGIRLDVAFLPLALGIAESFGLRILSGYRDPDRNARSGGAERSDHLCGAAVDLVGPMKSMKASQRWAEAQGFAYVDGPVTNRDGHHGDHVHLSFVRCG